jgi:hypothetical protein
VELRLDGHQQASPHAATSRSTMTHGLNSLSPATSMSQSRPSLAWGLTTKSEDCRNIEPEDWLMDQRVCVVTGPRLPKLMLHFCWPHLASPTSPVNSWLHEGYVISPRSPASSRRHLSLATRVPRTCFTEPSIASPSQTTLPLCLLRLSFFLSS